MSEVKGIVQALSARHVIVSVSLFMAVLLNTRILLIRADHRTGKLNRS